jgi:hypothetical protein
MGGAVPQAGRISPRKSKQYVKEEECGTALKYHFPGPSFEVSGKFHED